MRDPKLTKAQNLVKAITANHGLRKIKDHARTVSLPALLQRNGLLQTVIFLEGKRVGEPKDGVLLDLLSDALQAVMPDAPRLSRKALANIDTASYLLYSSIAIEAATWTQRLAQAENAEEAIVQGVNA